MNTTEAKQRVATDPDYVYLKRFGYSLEKLMERYPDGVQQNRIIANALMIPEHEVEELYQSAVQKLRMIIGVEE